MDVKQLLVNISDLVECNVCLKVFTDPRKLTCDHHYCLKCLQGIKQTHRNKLPCPKCRCETTLPGESVESLPKAFHVNSLLDVFRIKESEGTPVQCETCEQVTNSASYCFDCSDFICKNCTKAHKLTKQTRSHRVVALPQIEDSDIQTILERPAYCSKHKDELMKFYCLDCQVSICQRCAVVTHTGHKLEDIEETAERFKGQMKARIQRVEEKLEEVSTAKRGMQEEIALIQLSKIRVENELMSTVKKIARCFQKLVTKKNAAAENACKAVYEQINRARATEENIKKELSAMTSALSAVVPGNLGQDTSTEQEKKVGTICNTPMEQVNKVYIGYRPSMEFEKVLKEKNVGMIIQSTTVPSKCTAYGLIVAGLEAKIEVYTKNSQDEIQYCLLDNVAVKVKSTDGEITENVSAVTDSKTGKYEFVFTPAAREYEISVKVNKEAIQGSPFCVKATERQFRAVKWFGRKGKSAGQFDNPLGLSVSREGHIAVADTDNKRIQVFNAEGKVVVPTFGKKVLSYPVAVLYLNDVDNNILVSDTGKNVIQMFTNTGIFVRTFCKEGFTEGKVNTPRGLCLDEACNVVVCDYENNRVQVLSPKGEFIRILVKEDKGLYPMYCTYNKGYYYVTIEREDGKRNVKVFGNNGDRIGTICSDGFYCGVVVDDTDRIIVTDAGNKGLRVYHEGVLVTKVYSDGNEPDQFNCDPSDIKLLPDGRIAVADVANNRIQIMAVSDDLNMRIQILE